MSGELSCERRWERGGERGEGREERGEEEEERTSLIITQGTVLTATWKKPPMPTWCANDS